MEYLANTVSIALVATILVVVIQMVLWKRRYTEQTNGKKPLPPGTMGWPFVGETLHFLSVGPKFFWDKFSKYGMIYKTHILGSPTIRVAGADIIRDLVAREPTELTLKWPIAIEKLFGAKSLSVVTGDQHARLKKIVYTVFDPTRLSDYLPCVQNHVRSNLLSWPQQGRILGFQACRKLVADMMTEVLLGLGKDNDDGRKVRDAIAVVNKNLFSVPIELPGSGFKKGMQARRLVQEFVKARIDRTGDKDHVCMVDIFLSRHGTSDGMTDEEIMDLAVSLFIAGNDTTTSSLCFCLLLLGRHPEVVEKIRQELDEFGLLDKDTSESLTYDILQKLKYVQSVEKEVLRVSTPVGATFRKTNVDIETKDYVIPKDWTLIYGIRETHSSAEVIDDRDAFRPERWLDPDFQKQMRSSDSFNYLPFGVGSRMCVGRQLARMVMHVFLVESVRLVQWELENPHPPIVALPIAAPKDSLPVRFKARA